MNSRPVNNNVYQEWEYFLSIQAAHEALGTLLFCKENGLNIFNDETAEVINNKMNTYTNIYKTQQLKIKE
jgi:hypothetical protein